MLHNLKQEKKHLTLDLQFKKIKIKKYPLRYDNFLTVQYLGGPSGEVEGRALAAVAVTGLLPEH